MIKPIYHRQFRTASSEQFDLMSDDERLGHIDLHYGAREVFGTLVLDRELSDDVLSQVMERITEDLVDSTDVPRDELYVRVFVGRELEPYSEGLEADELLVDGYEGLEED